MKKRYITADMDIIEFDEEDIITYSPGTGIGGDGDDDDPPIEETPEYIL